MSHEPAGTIAALAGGEQRLRIAVGLRLVALGEVRRPLGHRLPNADELRVGELRLARDQRLAALFATPVVRADAGEHHLAGVPLVGGAERHRDVFARGLHLVEGRVELGLGGRRFQSQLAEDLLVVEEAVDDRGHRDAVGVLAVVGLPGHLGRVGEVGERRVAVELLEMALLVQVSHETSKGRQVIRSPALPEARRADDRVVFGRRGGRELHGDARVGLRERWQQHRVPQRLGRRCASFPGSACRHRRVPRRSRRGRPGRSSEAVRSSGGSFRREGACDSARRGVAQVSIPGPA